MKMLQNKHVFYFLLPVSSMANWLQTPVPDPDGEVGVVEGRLYKGPRTLTIYSGGDHPDESWGAQVWCSDWEHISGVQVKVETLEEGGGDNTALNGLKIQCTQNRGRGTGGSNGEIKTVDNGNYGTWSEMKRCKDGYAINGFAIRNEKYKGEKPNHSNTRCHCKDEMDDTALNGLEVQCVQLNSQKNTERLVAHYGYWGEWTDLKKCPENFLARGIQLKTQSYQGPSLNSNGMAADDVGATGLKVWCIHSPRSFE